MPVGEESIREIVQLFVAAQSTLCKSHKNSQIVRRKNVGESRAARRIDLQLFLAELFMRTDTSWKSEPESLTDDLEAEGLLWLLVLGDVQHLAAAPVGEQRDDAQRMLILGKGRERRERGSESSVH